MLSKVDIDVLSIEYAKIIDLEHRKIFISSVIDITSKRQYSCLTIVLIQV